MVGQALSRRWVQVLEARAGNPGVGRPRVPHEASVYSSSCNLAFGIVGLLHGQPVSSLHHRCVWLAFSMGVCASKHAKLKGIHLPVLTMRA